MGYEQIFPLFPTLSWGNKECPETQDFFEEAQKWIPDEHVQWLELVMDGELDKVNLHDCQLLSDIIEFDQQLRNELSVLKEGKGGTTILPSNFLSDRNPLEREEELLWLKWQFLDTQQEPEDSWGLKAVFIYMLQLRILIRRYSFIKDEGAERFAALCSIVSEAA